MLTVTIKTKMTLTYVLFAIICLCMFAMYVLDAKYANNPQIPNAAVGRVFEHPIRYHGQVYLTASEYAGYRWLTRILIASGVSIVLLHAVDPIWKWIRKFVHPPNTDGR